MPLPQVDPSQPRKAAPAGKPSGTERGRADLAVGKKDDLASLSGDLGKSKEKDLESKLREKEELVQALTEQLELAAEQLDRLQRSGADRKHLPFSGIPISLVEEQKQVLGDLQRVVQQWEDMQAVLTLGRLEVQISELQDFVQEKLSRPFVVAQSTVAVAGLMDGPGMAPGMGLPAPSTGNDPWASLKERMLEEDQPVIELSEPEPAEEIPEVSVPAPLDVSAATRDQLEQAIDMRDAYIAFLLRKSRISQGELRLPEWSQIANVPDKLKDRVEKLAEELESRLRLSEIEISVERARIARDQMKLRQAQDQFERQRRQMGIEEDAVGNSGSGPANTGAAGAADRRWSRFLGVNRRSE